MSELLEGFAGFEAADVINELWSDLADRRTPCDMGQDGDFWMVPERAVFR